MQHMGRCSGCTNLNSSNVKHCPQFIKNTFLCILSVIVRISFSIRPEGEEKNESILCKNSDFLPPERKKN